MLTGVHFLLTYTCTYECDHCFLYCSPRAEGTFTLEQLWNVFNQMKQIESIDWVYFEGGEPFLFYPLMVQGLITARNEGYKTGVVTNAYWATCESDAVLWLRPLAQLGLSDLSVSDDAFHNEGDEPPAHKARAAADKIGIPSMSICIEKPNDNMATEGAGRGDPVIGGTVMFRGRAVEKLVEGRPGQPADRFDSCPYEDLENPGRVHVDPFGHVHLCQGISLGNLWETPLKTLLDEYRPNDHPICGPLIAGGPVKLAREYDIPCPGEYLDACHLCSVVRKALMTRFSAILAPPLIYGVEQAPQDK